MRKHRPMILAGFMTFTLALSLISCGETKSDPPGASVRTTNGTSSNAVLDPAKHVISPSGFVKDDADDDRDDRSILPSKEDEQEMTPATRYGASPADRRAITAIVKTYLTDAAAADGKEGCSLLASAIAKGAGEEAAARGRKGCPDQLAYLYKQQHVHMAVEEVSSVVVTGVHVLGDAGFATLGFRKATESELLLRREQGHWKIDALFDSILP